jgi:hypothetical protein
MFTCQLCHFEIELDDVAIAFQGGRCICLRCFERATDTAKPMANGLRHQVIATLAAVA